jgi:hypothetical protein
MGFFILPILTFGSSPSLSLGPVFFVAILLAEQEKDTSEDRQNREDDAQSTKANSEQTDQPDKDQVDRQ